jgi:16S rRNA (cytosine1402-N4)-methyltransferase
MESQDVYHKPVMLKEVIEHLHLRPGHVVVDGTLGLGGHSLKILEQIGPSGKLIAIDQDEDALKIAKENLRGFTAQCFFALQRFSEMDQVVKEAGIEKVDGILLDLGISSFQINNPERGFSIRLEGPLDMRMNRKSHISARDIINTYPEDEIAVLLRDLGEERFYRKIAKTIVQERKKRTIETTGELAETVIKAVGYRRGQDRIHPATRTFQAIRIKVNDELGCLDKTIDKALNLLKTGGRIAVISFHSLEDRIVKNKFRSFAHSGLLNLIVKKPLRPQDEEVEENTRSRSARLRIAERV